MIQQIAWLNAAIEPVKGEFVLVVVGVKGVGACSGGGGGSSSTGGGDGAGGTNDGIPYCS